MIDWLGIPEKPRISHEEFVTEEYALQDSFVNQVFKKHA